MVSGFRPARTAAERIFSTLLRTFSGVWPVTKIASACLLPKAIPVGELPAWKRKGVRWGEGSQMWGPATEKWGPWWLMGRTNSGWAKGPVWRLRGTELVAQLLSQSWGRGLDFYGGRLRRRGREEEEEEEEDRRD